MFGKQVTNFIPFKEGDPVGFDEYQGQEALKERLLLRLNAMKRGENFKCLLSASAGQGKTSLARIIARTMMEMGLADNYFEIIAGKLDTKQAVDTFMRRIPAYSVIMIDEIHGLRGISRDSLYPAIQDNVYSFSEYRSMKPLPEGISWIGATTNLGDVHAALQRRLIPMHLAPLTVKDLAWVALLQPREVGIDAAFEMASKCHSPWEIKDELYVAAGDIATKHGSKYINIDHVKQACDLLGIDSNGLRPRERTILECLFKHPKIMKNDVVYALAKGPLVAMAQIDEQTYINQIEPKLMMLQYLSVRSAGRCLTEKALETYFATR